MVIKASPIDGAGAFASKAADGPSVVPDRHRITGGMAMLSRAAPVPPPPDGASPTVDVPTQDAVIASSPNPIMPCLTMSPAGPLPEAHGPRRKIWGSG